MAGDIERELIELNERLLECIAAADWDTYQTLCDPSLSAFEPEARGYLVEGMDFHRFYFELGANSGARQTTMIDPRVRLMGDVAVVAYVRLLQHVDPQGQPATKAFEETRVWQRVQGIWRHVHFHRSANR